MKGRHPTVFFFFFHMHKSKNHKLTQLELLTLGADTIVTHILIWDNVLMLLYFKKERPYFQCYPQNFLKV